jgi:pimeloyl-ACP methyl ester carboxylesterase
MKKSWTMKKTFKQIFITTMGLLYFISGSVACSQSYNDVRFNYKKKPVLFVHGAGLTSKTWDKMIDSFIRSGYPPSYLYAVDIIPRHESNITAAQKFIKPAVEKLLKDANRTANEADAQIRHFKVDIVAHSMGAVSSRYFAAKIAPEKVNTWISIAGSNHGTDALCPYKNEGLGNQEMCPAFARSSTQNPLQVALNGTFHVPVDETPYGFGKDRNPDVRVPPDRNRSIAYYSIYIEPDRWIKPENSALLEGAGGQSPILENISIFEETISGNYMFNKNVQHDFLPKNTDIINFVLILLKNNQ